VDTARPALLTVAVVLAVLPFLGCGLDDLIDRGAAPAPAARRAAGENSSGRSGGAGVGEFRPRRARILPSPEDGPAK
ncbi:hypothetical protein ACFWR9_08360, partial [Streptomyces sp. NPDC058534]